MTDLSTLLERVRACKGADREIDILAWEIFHRVVIARDDLKWTVKEVDGEDGMCPYVIRWPSNGKPWIDPQTTSDIPRYTEDVSAVIALAERVLPGWGWILRSNDADLGCHARIGLSGKPKMFGFSNGLPTPATALLGAILAAKIAQEEPK